jgi:hypothetical protein
MVTCIVVLKSNDVAVSDQSRTDERPTPRAQVEDSVVGLCVVQDQRCTEAVGKLGLVEDPAIWSMVKLLAPREGVREEQPVRGGVHGCKRLLKLSSPPHEHKSNAIALELAMEAALLEMQHTAANHILPCPNCAQAFYQSPHLIQPAEAHNEEVGQFVLLDHQLHCLLVVRWIELVRWGVLVVAAVCRSRRVQQNQHCNK